MSDPLSKSKPATSQATPNVTSLPGSEDGQKPCASPDSPQLDLFGLPLSLASPSARPANNSASKMSVTSGPSSLISSKSASLTLSLGNKLRERLASTGSMEYEQTWKERTTPSGLRYWEHTASGRRTSGSGSIGWPTPAAQEPGGTPEAHLLRKEKAVAKGSQMGCKSVTHLSLVAQMTAWPSPNAMPENRGGLQSNPQKALERLESGHQFNLDDAACLTVTPRASPSARDWKDTPGMATEAVNPDGSVRTRLDQLPRQAALAPWTTPQATEPATEDFRPSREATGRTTDYLGRQVIGIQPSGSSVSTEKRGALNPAFSLWLMGYRDEWHSCGAQAMQSCRKLPRRSSARSSKLNPKNKP